MRRRISAIAVHRPSGGTEHEIEEGEEAAVAGVGVTDAFGAGHTDAGPVGAVERRIWLASEHRRQPLQARWEQQGKHVVVSGGVHRDARGFPRKHVQLAAKLLGKPELEEQDASGCFRRGEFVARGRWVARKQPQLQVVHEESHMLAGNEVDAGRKRVQANRDVDHRAGRGRVGHKRADVAEGESIAKY